MTFYGFNTVIKTTGQGNNYSYRALHSLRTNSQVVSVKQGWIQGIPKGACKYNYY